MRAVAYLFSSLVLTVVACGDDGGDSVTPTLVPGGGVRDPGIEGTVHVYAIDVDTDAPIVGAGVLVGDKEGVTDGTGLFTASGVTGPQTVAIKATGYATSVWVGLDSANLTAALDRTPESSTVPKQAELAGTITGWATLPAPAADHFAAAVVSYSHSRELGANDNELDPPDVPGDLDANVCARAAVGPVPACAWRINARTGRVQPYAVVFDVDTRGTAIESDDVVTITGFAIGPVVTVVDRANQANLALTLLPAGSTTTAQVNFGTPPTGLATTFGIVGVDVGEAGLLQIGTAGNTSTSIVMPSLSAIAGSTYQLTAIAQEDVADGTAAQSIVVRRNLASASAIAAGDWLPPPTGLSSDRATVSFGRVAGASVQTVEIDTRTGAVNNRQMSVIVLDDSATVTLPTAFAPLPAGSILVRASAIDVGVAFDPQEFAIDDFEDILARISSETIRLN